MKHVYMSRDVREAVGARLNTMPPGLRADKYPVLPHWELAAGDAKHARQHARSDTVRALCKANMPDLDWQATARAFVPPRSHRFYGRLMSRLVVNQTAGVVENAGVCLHRTFGTPMIPGTATKGIARAQAIRELIEAGEAERDALLNRILIVFGFSSVDIRPERTFEHCPDLIQAYHQRSAAPAPIPVPRELAHQEAFAGVVSFLPALPASPMQIVPDIVTCHHMEYYKEKQPVAFDNESPNPNAFPAVAAREGEDALFCFTVAELPRWLRVEPVLRSLKGVSVGFDPPKAAADWLAQGLIDFGMGAKTAAGYGWFKVDPETDRRIAKEEEAKRQAERAEQAAQEREKERIAGLSAEERCVEELSRMLDQEFIEEIKALPQQDEVKQRAVLTVLRTAKLALWEKDRKAKLKKKAGKRAAIVREVAARLGEAMPE